MSFRTRLIGFFLVIVVVPMAAVGFLVFRLIDQSQSGKADARASGIASAAAGVYQSASMQASLHARAIASQLALTSPRRLRGRTVSLATTAGLARVTVSVAGRQVVDFGDQTAIAPGIAVVEAIGGRAARTVTASQLTASQYVSELDSPGVEIVVRSGRALLAASHPAAAAATLPPRGSVTIGANEYRVTTERFAGFDRTTVSVVILSSLAATGGSVDADRWLAALFIAGFLTLAFFFALLASRALHAQLAEFLQAARRLASGDFSSPVPTAGNDEFALLGQEFNNMSEQLERRLGELEQERRRVRESIRRIGEAFASGLDRDALLELALQTAIDATEARSGQISARQAVSEPLQQTLTIGPIERVSGAVADCERNALATGDTAQASVGDEHLATVALGPMAPGGPPRGLITVCRPKRPLTADDLELLRTLAAQATLALANVSLHHDIHRQAITDDLTGLATHGRFQQLLEAEMEEVRRYRYPVGLLMLDIDDFKAINDRYGHQQGDLVLRWVADTLRQTSRDVDMAARYGGEELAVILPHTDLAGAFEMGERVRQAIEALQIPLLDEKGALRVTTSAGAASSADGVKNDLIAAADGALYVAKREGKNRTVKAKSRAANVVGGE